MEIDANTIVAMVAVVLGVALRAVAPFLKKKKLEGGTLAFKWQFSVALVVSIIVTALAVVEALSVMVVPEGSIFAIFVASFSWGFVFESAMARMVEAYLAEPEPPSA